MFCRPSLTPSWSILIHTGRFYLNSWEDRKSWTMSFMIQGETRFTLMPWSGWIISSEAAQLFFFVLLDSDCDNRDNPDNSDNYVALCVLEQRLESSRESDLARQKTAENRKPLLGTWLNKLDCALKWRKRHVSFISKHAQPASQSLVYSYHVSF